MQKSPTISIERELSSVTISRTGSERSLNKINKLGKWYRIAKRIIQFLRFIKIPLLRSRFIDMIKYISADQLKFEQLNDYETNKTQEDLLFIDDIKRYQEVFKTFSSFGFVWHDKEFRLAKLKANYIYDRYMSTSEAIAKTNIPLDTIPIPFINNKINSLKISASLTYQNLFNDAEKYILEKLLMIYMHEGLNCFSVLSQKQSIPIMNRLKGSRIRNGSISSVEQLKERNKGEKSISNSSNIKLKNKRTPEPQYDELILPNWTYSTELGVIYNPIREKRIKIIKKNVRNKTKDFDQSVNAIIKLNQDTPNEIKSLDTTFSKSVIPISSPNVYHSSKFLPRVNPQYIKHNSKYFISTQKSFQNSNRFASPHYYRCDTVFNRNIFDKKQFLEKVFICKVHSSPWSEFNRSVLENKESYRMARIPQATHFVNAIQKPRRLCR